MTTMFIDTNGEMSFVDNERLKFIMHYLKQGADDSLVEMKDGRFVREDSELSFTEIWLPAAEHQQRKIDEQQAKVEGLQEEFAEDERFLKEQIKDKDLKISNLEYLQGMDKELIQTLQGRSAALQDRVNELEGKLKQADEDVDTFATAHEALEQRVDRDRSLIQFTQKANKDLIAERDELQKRVDAALELCKKGGALSSCLAMRVEKALKGEG